MSNYEKKIQKNIHKHDEEKKETVKNSQLVNLVKIFAIVTICIVVLTIITYFLQK